MSPKWSPSKTGSGDNNASKKKMIDSGAVEIAGEDVVIELRKFQDSLEHANELESDYTETNLKGLSS